MRSLSVVHRYAALPAPKKSRTSPARQSFFRASHVAQPANNEWTGAPGMRGVMIASLLGSGIYLLLAVAAYNAIA